MPRYAALAARQRGTAAPRRAVRRKIFVDFHSTAGCEDDNEENYLVKQCFEEFPNSSTSRSGSPSKVRDETKIETKNETKIVQKKLNYSQY